MSGPTINKSVQVQQWLKERRTIHNAATEGPWEAEAHAPEDSDYQSFGVAAGDVYVVFELPWDAAGAGKLDAEAIVDAHNTLPALLTAVGKVLELHKPVHQVFSWQAGRRHDRIRPLRDVPRKGRCARVRVLG